MCSILKSILIYKSNHNNSNNCFMDTPRSITISEKFKKRVWLVAFDMDQTCLDIHTSGVGIRDNQIPPPQIENSPYKIRKASEVVNHVKEVVKTVIPTLLKNGIAVAITTNTDKLMAFHPCLMGGREFVEYIFSHVFTEYPDICDHLFIEAWRGEYQAVQVIFAFY